MNKTPLSIFIIGLHSLVFAPHSRGSPSSRICWRGLEITHIPWGAHAKGPHWDLYLSLMGDQIEAQ